MDSVRQDYLGNLRRKSKPELLELLERQEKLLANKRFVAKLPDKGQKIISLKKHIERRLGLLKLDLATNTLSKLNIRTRNDEQLDSDDDDIDVDRVPSVWETLASNKIVCKKETGWKSDRSAKADAPNKEPQFYDSLAEAIDNLTLDKEPFREHKAKSPGSNNNASASGSEVKPRKVHAEEESAVRYPVGVCTEVKVLSLQESLQFAKQNLNTLKELQLSHAAEFLEQNMDELSLPISVPNIEIPLADYREIEFCSNSDDDDDGDANSEMHVD